MLKTIIARVLEQIPLPYIHEEKISFYSGIINQATHSCVRLDLQEHMTVEVQQPP